MFYPHQRRGRHVIIKNSCRFCLNIFIPVILILHDSQKINHKLQLPSRVPPEDPAALADAVREALGRARPDWAWVALESAATKSIRRLVGSAGVPRRAIQAQAYWIRGRAMGT